MNLQQQNPDDEPISTTQVGNNTFTKSKNKSTCSNKLPKTIYLLSLYIIISLSTSRIGAVDANSSPDEVLSRYTIIPTPSPEDNFSEQPTNVSIPEGSVAVMKCKVKKPVTHCRWFYTDLANDFYDTAITPKKVKEFTPTKSNDCSIRFTSVKKIQEGQWLCQARKYMSTSFYNTRPATLRVITESEERDYSTRGGDNLPHNSRDPPAPTAIPALQPPRHGGSDGEDEKVPQFQYLPDEQIQNTKTGELATLRCKVDQPVTSCSWLMPNDALFVWNDADSSTGRSLSINTPIVPLDSNVYNQEQNNNGNQQQQGEDYEFIGSRQTGNCSLMINRVKHHDEGNWRCVVKVKRSNGPPLPRVLAASTPPNELEVKGPLIHLHLLDFPHHVRVMPGSTTSQSTAGANYTLIALFLVGLVLFIIGAIIIYCCYKRVWSKQEEENPKLPQNSPARNNDPEYTQQWFQGRNLKILDPNYTDDFKLRNHNGNNINLQNIDAFNLKNSQQVIKYSDLDHYNQYITMNQECPGSVRSSASSNTTLSTVIPDPLGRDRSVSFGANSGMGSINHSMSPIVTQHCHNYPPEQQIPFYEIHRSIQRPVSLYSTGHVYEEIQDKMPVLQIPPNHIINKHGMIVPVAPQGSLPSPPVYTNVVEDNDGYLIPNKSVKIVNTPTEEIPSQYLAMRGDIPNTSLPDGQHQPQQNIPIVIMNNLSQNSVVTRHMQVLPGDQRRRSAESNQSQENNQAVDMSPSGHGPSTSTLIQDQASSQITNNSNQTKLNDQIRENPINTTPNSRRQRMPLPNPKAGQPTLQIHSAQNSNGNNKLGKLNLSSLHQRTTSLPDTSNSSSVQPNHAKSPSLVPTPENYDIPKNNTQVPRKLDAVPKSFNGSEISLDDIDGTIV